MLRRRYEPAQDDRTADRPNDPVEQLIDRVRDAYRKVDLFPEETPKGWVRLIELRILVPELVRELRRFNDAAAKR